MVNKIRAELPRSFGTDRLCGERLRLRLYLGEGDRRGLSQSRVLSGVGARALSSICNHVIL